MPQLDGYSMAQRLKEDDLTTGIPIIVVTIKETMKELFQKLGINNFFTKPFDTDKLLGVIRTILADNQ
jgi:CheY-like chemotaxis protein